MGVGVAGKVRNRKSIDLSRSTVSLRELPPKSTLWLRVRRAEAVALMNPPLRAAAISLA